MEWLVLVAPIALLVTVVVVPGGLILTILGRSGLRSITAAPAVSIGIVALAGLTCEVTGWRWGLVPVAIVTLLVAVVAMGVRRWGGPHLGVSSERSDPAERWRSEVSLAGIAAIVGGMALWLRHLTNVLPEPSAFSQTYDNVFHLNVVRFIHEVGDAGPWLPRNLDSGAVDVIFYPTAWHQLVALAMPASADQVHVASNAALFVVCGLVWPLSALELTLLIGVRMPGAVLSTGVLAAGFSAYPFLMLDWGVLFPNLLAYACAPAALAALVALTRAGPDPGRPLLSLSLVGGLSTVGVLLGHPNGLLLLLVLTLPALVDGVFHTHRLARSRRVAWRWATVWWIAAAVSLAAFAHLWRVARPSNRPWPPLHDVGTAFTQALFANPIMGPPGFAVAVLSALGLVLMATRRRHWWFIASSAIALALWVVGSGAADGPLREILTGGWYSDSYRLAPILVLMAVPASAFAIDRALRALRHQLGGRRSPRAERADWAMRAVTVLVPAVVLATTQWGPSLHHAVTHARTAYDYAEVVCPEGDVTCLLTRDELAVLFALPRLTPPDAVLLAEPLTGASLGYAFAGRAVLRPYISGPVSPPEQLLLDRLDTGPHDAALCGALHATRVTHILDFGVVTVHSGRVDRAGLDELAASPAVRELFRRGDAVLYEVIACR